MNHLFLSIICLTLISCKFSGTSNVQAESGIDGTETERIELEIHEISKISDNILIEPADISYDSILTSLELDRRSLKNDWSAGNISIDSISKYFCEALVNKIIPYWYGTPWDFNGHTDIPNESNVACGYFVSTPLRHMGSK